MADQRTLPRNLNPSDLEEDPQLLCHRARPGRKCCTLSDFFSVLTGFTALMSHDGMAGGVVKGGEWIITSPNSNIIPLPPLGGDRFVYLRENLRFGEDDPLQWPQPFIPQFPHLACIPRPIELPDNPRSILWLVPNGSYLDVEPHNMIRSIGCLHPTISGILLKAAEPIIAEAKRLDNHALAQELITDCYHFLLRLRDIPMTVRWMQLTFRELQRMLLELVTITDYKLKFKPKMHSPDVVPPAKAVTDRIGAFTTNLSICEKFYCAGLPVWLIRPFRDLPSIRVQSEHPVLDWDGAFPSEPATYPTHHSIFCGLASDHRKYEAIRYHTLTYFCYPNAFGTIRVEPSNTPTLAGTQREVRRQTYSPCEFSLCFVSLRLTSCVQIIRPNPRSGLILKYAKIVINLTIHHFLPIALIFTPLRSPHGSSLSRKSTGTPHDIAAATRPTLGTYSRNLHHL